MKTYHAQPIVEGLAFPEAPRWHLGRLWFTDQHGRAVHAVTDSGRLETVARTDDLPGGLGWLPDGSLIVVYMTSRRLMRMSDRTLNAYVDLFGLASFHCNDLVVDAQGRIYVGNFGFDLHGGADVRNAQIILVRPDGAAEVFCDDVVFPNGSVITPDGKTLLVAETFANRISAFGLDGKGRMKSKTTWADLGDATPDGICLDAEHALWVASPGTHELIRVNPDVGITARCSTSGAPYACMLGGADRRSLYVCTSETDDPREAVRLRSGRIERVKVEVPGIGLP